MNHKVFIDGAVGTTGLRIHERLNAAADITVLQLPEAHRKDPHARADMLAQADVSFLCLPDDAAREIIALAPEHARICDTSTAHRTHPDWVYGFPELNGQREKIQAAKRVAIPGCHATGLIALMRPLVEQGALSEQSVVACHSLTGYSGGGKSMIAEYTHTERTPDFDAPRVYALGLQHKHLPEMQAITGLQNAPLFTPIVADYYSGMLVTIPLPVSMLSASHQSGEAVAQLLAQYYANSALIRVHDYRLAPNMLPANALSGRDDLEIFIHGSDTQILLCARFDNLGKGASGAAVQCMNVMLGREETAGLVC